MAERRVQRRLAAILAADVAGFSRLIGADETGTLAALREIWTTRFNPAVAEYRGRVVKMMGDGALVEFASAVDAVECAIAIQRAMANHNISRPGREPIELRIGVNLGDIVTESGRIYGDGVNVAARVEALAQRREVLNADLHIDDRAVLAPVPRLKDRAFGGLYPVDPLPDQRCRCLRVKK